MRQAQLQHLEQHLKTWRETHADLASRRAAYRLKMVEFTLNSMALEGEPVDPGRLMSLLRTPTHRHDG